MEGRKRIGIQSAQIFETTATAEPRIDWGKNKQFKSSRSQTESSQKTGKETSSLLNQETLNQVAEAIFPQVMAKVLPQLIESLGIFVALFTFVSINIQIFSRITSINNAFIFVALMFLCLSGFVYILHLFLTNQKSGLNFFLMILTFCAVFILIFYFAAPRAPLTIEENSEFTKIESRIKSLEDKFETHLQSRR